MGHYVVFHHANGTATKAFLSFSSLLEQLLSQGDFVQSHRSYVVNLRYVHRIEKHSLVMLDDTQIPLPKSRYQQLSDRFQDIIFGGEGL
jgi:DNA-binding LytR/AlgR family response regulator